MKLHNTLSNEIEEFKPIHENNVNMYVCGPTVYDYPHLGHARCYITWDMLYRYLKFLGYNVKYCRNITDVDDKILKKAKEENTTAEVISKRYYEIFSEAMKKLNVLKPDIEPFATKTLGEMISIIKDLIAKGYAYEVQGDVYFRVKEFKEYGKLSKQPIEDLIAGARVEASSKKEDVLDFALWKRDEETGYASPWGKGRPGWHIECSAMSRKHLAKHIDIHAGGADLIFPHHENEIAQSECANGCKFVNYWLHNGFVTINKEKMSKSLKNFVTINDLLESYDANTIRFFILTNHYRMPVEFSSSALEGAKAGWKRIQTAVNTVIKYTGKNNLPVIKDSEEVLKFKEAMDNDLNTSKALAVIFDTAAKANKSVSENQMDTAKKYAAILLLLTDVMGFNIEKEKLSEDEIQKKLDSVMAQMDFLIESDRELKGYALMEKIIEYRNNARKAKNWELADKIRNVLDSISIVLKDTKETTYWEEN
ncbi:MAG: cysteine--tRNA ligase [Candidatus Gastranaerophilales bacterium]|nr:cysteine--tRNA ligase [Candidatus Gastranaerophilales bacterium]